MQTFFHSNAREAHQGINTGVGSSRLGFNKDTPTKNDRALSALARAEWIKEELTAARCLRNCLTRLGSRDIYHLPLLFVGVPLLIAAYPCIVP